MMITMIIFALFAVWVVASVAMSTAWGLAARGTRQSELGGLYERRS